MTMSKMDEFASCYGKRTANVIKYLLKGWSNRRIASQLKITERSVATFKSNLTRGTYYGFVDYSPKKGLYFV